jgi:hypothetical protein
MSRLASGASALLVLALTSAALTGCAQFESLGNSVHTLVEDLAKPVPPASETQDVDFVLGDCFDRAALDDYAPKKPVMRSDCSLLHDFEVYAVVEIPDIGYPGEDKIISIALQECRERFSGFTGGDPRYSTLDFSYIVPPDADWSTGDHDAECVIFQSDGSPLTGTARYHDKDLATPSPEPTADAENGSIKNKTFGELAVGDCYDGYDGTTGLKDVAIIVQPCQEPHFVEVFATPKLGFASYPGDADVNARANELCFTAFKDYVGIDYDYSYLAVGYTWPSESDWTGRNTHAVCVALRYAIGPLLEGSVKNTGL